MNYLTLNMTDTPDNRHHFKGLLCIDSDIKTHGKTMIVNIYRNNLRCKNVLGKILKSIGDYKAYNWHTGVFINGDDVICESSGLTVKQAL